MMRFCWLIVGLLLLSSEPVSAQQFYVSGSQGTLDQGVSDCTTSYMFANFAKCLGSLQSTAGDSWPGLLNENNYPSSSPVHNIFGQLTLPPSYNGNWVIKFNGSGDVQLARGSPGFTVISDPGTCVSGGTGFNLTISSTCTNPRVVFACATTACNVLTFNFLASGTFTNMSGLVICRTADESSIDANGNGWNPDFITQMQQLNPLILRTLSLNDVNDSNNAANYNYRTPLGGLTNFSSRWEPMAWAGTVSGTDTYTVSQPSNPITLSDGDTIQVHFTNANTITTPTLAVGATAATTITDIGGSTLGGAGVIAAGANATLVYSKQLNVWLYTPTGITSLTPMETLVNLANTLGLSLWFNFPNLMNNSSMTSAATYACANLNKTFYAEYSNEVWNPGAGFIQTSYATNAGRVIGFPNNNNRFVYGWYAFRSRQMFGLIESVCSASKVQKVLAFQAFGPGGTGGSTNIYRLQGTDLTLDVNGLYTTVPGNIVTNYSQAPNRPIDHANVMAYAHYYSGAELKNFDTNYLPTSGNCGSTTTCAYFTGAISSTTLTVSSVTDGKLAVGQGIGGASVSDVTKITAMSPTVACGGIACTGTGGTGTYAVNNSQSVGSESLVGFTFFDLLTNANTYAAGGAANINTALNWVDNDVLNGVDSAGNTWPQTISQLNANIYPAWETVAATYTGIVVRAYEGAYEGFYPSATVCTNAGILAAYCGSTGSIATLLNAYKSDQRFFNTVTVQLTEFMSQSHSRSAAWLVTNGGQWGLTSTDLYSTAWKSFGAVQQFN